MMYHIHYIVLTWYITSFILYSHGVSHPLYCSHMICHIHYIVTTWCITSIIL